MSDTFGIRCAFDGDEEEEEQRGLRDSFGQVGCLITFFFSSFVNPIVSDCIVEPVFFPGRKKKLMYR